MIHLLFRHEPSKSCELDNRDVLIYANGDRKATERLHDKLTANAEEKGMDFSYYITDLDGSSAVFF